MNVYYSAQGAGDLNIQASVSMIVSETYSLIDAKYYASNSRIESEGSPFNNDRIIFASTYTVSNGDEIHFRFKTTPPQAIVGVGSNQGSDFTLQKTTSGTYNLYRNRNGNATNISATQHGFYTTQDLIMDIQPDSTYSKANIYQGDKTTLQNWWVFNLSIRKIRVDKFYNYDYDIEVFVL